MKTKLQPSKLKEKTLELLKNRNRNLTLDEISNKTKIGKDWLKDFSANTMENPGVCMIEALYNFLSDKPLFNE
mgnify:CR=1 FL=1